MTFLNFGERDDVLVKGRITWKIDKLWRKKLQCSSLPKFWETKWAYVYWGYGVSFIKGWRAEITFFLSRTEQIVQACNYRAGPLLRPYVTDLIKGLVVKARPNKVWPITRERCYSSWGQLAWDANSPNILSEVQEQSEVNRVFWRRTKHGQHTVMLFGFMYLCLLCTTLALCPESMVFIGIYTCLLAVIDGGIYCVPHFFFKFVNICMSISPIRMASLPQ